MQIVGGRRERSCSVEMLLSAALLVTAVALLVTCNVPPSEGWEAAPMSPSDAHPPPARHLRRQSY